MNLAKCLIDNPNLNIESYLHQLLPAILTCLLGRKFSDNPNDNHWLLRDYCAHMISQLCNKFCNSYPSLQPRISKTLIQAFLDPKKPLTTHYGAIVGLTKLGRHVTQLLLIPNIKDYMTLLHPELMSSNLIRKQEAMKCHEALLIAAKQFYRELSEEESLLSTSNLSTDNSIEEEDYSSTQLSNIEKQKLLGCSETILVDLTRIFGNALFENKG